MNAKSVSDAQAGISRRGFLVAGAVSAATLTILSASADAARAETAAEGPTTQEAETLGRPPVALDSSLALPPTLPSLGTSFLR